MKQTPELADLYLQLHKADWTRVPPLLERAIAVATEANDEDSLYQLRRMMVDAASYLGDAPTQLASFTTVVEQHLHDPERFPNVVTSPSRSNLEYQIGNTMDTLAENSSVTRDQLEQAMASAYRVYHLHGTADTNVPVDDLARAIYLGDTDRLSELAEQMRRITVVGTSRCEACDRHLLIHADLNTGNLDAALTTAELMLRDKLSCPIEPAFSFARLLIPALLEGHLDFVSRHFERVNSTVAPSVSERVSIRLSLLPLAALTENLAFGLAEFEQRLVDLAGLRYNDLVRLEFFAAGAVLLTRAAVRGLGQRAVRDTTGALAAFGIGSGDETVESLAPQLWSAAEELAARFDSGRGNTFRSDRLNQMRSWSAVSIPLPLGPQPEPAMVTVPDPARSSAEWVTWAATRLRLSDPMGALEACTRALNGGDLDPSLRTDALGYRLRAQARVWQTAAGVTRVAELDPESQAELANQFAELTAGLIDTGRPSRAAILTALGLAQYDRGVQHEVDRLTTLLEQFDDAPAADRSLLEAHLSSALAEAGRSTEAIEMAIRAAEHAEAGSHLEERHRTWLFAGTTLARFGHAESRTWFERVVAETPDLPGTRAIGLLLLTQSLAAAGEWEQAIAAAAQAIELFTEVDAPRWAADAAWQQASLLEHTGDLAGAIRATRRILHLTAAVESFNSVPAQLQLARLLVLTGQAADAVPILADVDAELAENEGLGTHEAYQCAYWMGRAHRDLGDVETTASLWRAALDKAKANPAAAEWVAEFSWVLGELLAAHGQGDAAVEVLEAMRAILRAGDNPLAEISLDMRIGLITCMNGDASGIDLLLRARSNAEAAAASWEAADITEVLARGLRALGRSDEAVAAALDACDRFTAAGDQRNGSEVLGLAATILAENRRFDEAIALLEPVAPEDPPLAALLEEIRKQSS